MPTLNYIAKRLGLFLVAFILLTLLFTVKPIKDAHRGFYCSVGPIFFNLVNPYLHGDFLPEAEEDTRYKYFNWDMTFNIYDKRLIKKKLNKKTIRNTRPTLQLEQNHKQFILVPTIFLLSLFIVSPVSWMTKLIRLPLALITFYCFLGLYFSYTFERMIQEKIQGSFKVDSLWDGILWLFGFGRTHEAIYMIILFIWTLFLGPKIYEGVKAKWSLPESNR